MEDLRDGGFQAFREFGSFGRLSRKAEDLQASELTGLGLRAFDPEAFRALFQMLAIQFPAASHRF